MGLAEARDETLSHGITRDLAARTCRYRYETLPQEAIAVAKQCILDWFAVTLAGAGEPLTRILTDELAQSGGEATLIGSSARARALDAALINGSASHALDYDDVNVAMSGHPTVAVLPAVLAQAEISDKSGKEILASFVAGYEAACRIGLLMLPSHYARGFHATGTVGTFGAAAAAGHLLALDEAQMATALGLAGTQAAGLKSMFGTMAKPFHAGKAAANGLLAARLAGRGFEARHDVLEVAQGFVSTLSEEIPVRALDDAAPGAHVRNNLFKYHAACYLTHSTIEAAKTLAEKGLEPQRIESLVLHVPKGHLGVCNIQSPVTGLESKFSLRHAAALALGGEDTSSLGTYSDRMATAPNLVDLRGKAIVQGDLKGPTAARVVVALKSGEKLEAEADVGIPATDLDQQQQRLDAKFRGLVVPVLGSRRADELLALIADLENQKNLRQLFALCGN